MIDGLASLFAFASIVLCQGCCELMTARSVRFLVILDKPRRFLSRLGTSQYHYSAEERYQAGRDRNELIEGSYQRPHCWPCITITNYHAGNFNDVKRHEGSLGLLD